MHTMQNIRGPFFTILDKEDQVSPHFPHNENQRKMIKFDQYIDLNYACFIICNVHNLLHITSVTFITLGEF